jgi:hypothetical protein
MNIYKEEKLSPKPDDSFLDAEMAACQLGGQCPEPPADDMAGNRPIQNNPYLIQ